MSDRMLTALMAFASAISLALSVNASNTSYHEKSQTLNLPPLPKATKGISGALELAHAM